MMKTFLITLVTAGIVLHFTGSPVLTLLAVLSLGILFAFDTGTAGTYTGTIQNRHRRNRG